MANYNITESGHRIRELRTKAHLTQEELANILGLSTKQVGNIETGKSGSTLDKLMDMSELFDCTIEYLVDGTMKGSRREFENQKTPTLTTDGVDYVFVDEQDNNKTYITTPVPLGVTNVSATPAKSGDTTPLMLSLMVGKICDQVATKAADIMAVNLAELMEKPTTKPVVSDKPEWFYKDNLTLEEAVDCFGIGRGTLRNLTDQPGCPFVLWVGTKRLIKKELFREYIKETSALESA